MNDRATSTTELVIDEIDLVCTRDQLIIEEQFNHRRYYGDLPQLGTSLEGGQILPLFVVPVGDGKTYSVRDGFRRVKAFDLGYAPSLAVTGWKVTVLMLPNGQAPPERITRRYVATLNRIRKQWTPIEEARYYEDEIRDAIADGLALCNQERAAANEKPLMELPTKERERIIQQTEEQLAYEEECTALTIRNYRDLLKLPECVQAAIASGKLAPETARTRFADLDEESARILLTTAAEIAHVDLPITIIDQAIAASGVVGQRGNGHAALTDPGPMVAPPGAPTMRAPKGGTMPKPGTSSTIRMTGSGTPAKTSNPSPLPVLEPPSDPVAEIDDVGIPIPGHIQAPPNLFDDDGDDGDDEPASVVAPAIAVAPPIAPSPAPVASPKKGSASPRLEETPAETVPGAEPETGRKKKKATRKSKITRREVDEAAKRTGIQPANRGAGGQSGDRYRGKKEVDAVLVEYQREAKELIEQAKSAPLTTAKAKRRTELQAFIKLIRWLQGEFEAAP